MKTLTAVGIRKQLERLRDSLDYATYLLGGVKKQVSIYRVDINNNTIKIYVYLDSTVSGAVKDISLVDRDGDVIALAARQFTKPATKGIYSVFAYELVEVERPD
ncbi:hypothetical protein SDC9_106089 [bioreactor metagenome]|uniref:Uncharacterized protein n=1 Tax=bioreactor metagenome TaxID=1076179 RepID=A0A645B1H2_9ZZZZ